MFDGECFINCLFLQRLNQESEKSTKSFPGSIVLRYHRLDYVSYLVIITEKLEFRYGFSGLALNLAFPTTNQQLNRDQIELGLSRLLLFLWRTKNQSY